MNALFGDEAKRFLLGVRVSLQRLRNAAMPACARSRAAARKAASTTQGAARTSSTSCPITARLLARIAAQAASSSSRLAAVTSCRQVRTSTVSAASANLYYNLDVATGNATQAGTLNYQSAEVTLSA